MKIGNEQYNEITIYSPDMTVVAAITDGFMTTKEDYILRTVNDIAENYIQAKPKTPAEELIVAECEYIQILLHERTAPEELACMTSSLAELINAVSNEKKE